MHPGRLVLCALIVTGAAGARAEAGGWYTEGDFAPAERVGVTIVNTLDIARKDVPIIIAANSLPDADIPERYITVVDPSLPGKPEPSAGEIAVSGGYLERGETNGHFLQYQMDDTDRDGIWDELFFMVDMAPRETKTVYLYTGQSSRGLYPHKTHAGMGNYGRHVVPFWESEYIGWKLWYPTDVDLHGKRTPMLTAYREYSGNLSGYFMPPEYGSDIMAVSSTFGAGGICLFEYPSLPDSLSRPRFSPTAGKGPYTGTRYAFDVVYNGPLRSAIRVRTLNWNTGAGHYEADQLYVAYAHKSYSTCTVSFPVFAPAGAATAFGCGIREIMGQVETYRKDGLVISFGKNVDVRPKNATAGEKGIIVDFEGIALVVKDGYAPEYRDIPSGAFAGNHVFRIPATPERRFEYLIAAGWSEGPLNRTPEEFKHYMITVAQEYNNPPVIQSMTREQKPAAANTAKK